MNPKYPIYMVSKGRWETRLTVDAAKLYADGKGVEKAAPLADTRVPMP